jgi:hypothetical protein
LKTDKEAALKRAVSFFLEVFLDQGGFSCYSLQVLAAVVPPLLWAFRCYQGRCWFNVANTPLPKIAFPIEPFKKVLLKFHNLLETRWKFSKNQVSF